MVADTQWFVMKAISREWGCSILETRFAVHDLAKLQSICGPHGLDYLRLDDDVANEIAAAFDLPQTCNDCDYGLARWKPNEIPYLIHTNFELPLMLDGRKPLAVFWDSNPADLLEDLLEPFAPYIASGQIVSRIIEKPLAEPKQGPTGVYFYGTIVAYFAMPDQVWRIEEHEHLYKEAETKRWNEDFERRQGSLLGYTEAQNDWWITNKYVDFHDLIPRIATDADDTAC